jgi:hypothetical protein
MCFGDALSTTAQAFLPGFIADKGQRGFRKITMRILFLG